MDTDCDPCSERAKKSQRVAAKHDPPRTQSRRGCLHEICSDRLQHWRLPADTTPASVSALLQKFTKNDECVQIAHTLPLNPGCLHMRLYFCAEGRVFVGFVECNGTDECLVPLKHAYLQARAAMVQARGRRA